MKTKIIINIGGKDDYETVAITLKEIAKKIEEGFWTGADKMVGDNEDVIMEYDFEMRDIKEE